MPPEMDAIGNVAVEHGVVEEKYKLIPTDGIFAVTVSVAGNQYKGMAYIGTRPTVNGLTRNIEVNIFDFD